MTYYIRIVNDELPAPLYVERGLGFGGVKITGSMKNARRYPTREEAEKIAGIARAQKNKEPGGESTTVEIVAEGVESVGGWDIRARFDIPSSGAESRFEMCKTAEGIRSRYVEFSGTVSKEYGADQMRQAAADWTNSVGAWFASKIGAKK